MDKTTNIIINPGSKDVNKKLIELKEHLDKLNSKLKDNI